MKKEIVVEEGKYVQVSGFRFCASVDGHGPYGFGNTPQHAIGDLVFLWPEKFCVEIKIK